jgi:hypothetical protein
MHSKVEGSTPPATDPADVLEGAMAHRVGLDEHGEAMSRLVPDPSDHRRHLRSRNRRTPAQSTTDPEGWV